MITVAQANEVRDARLKWLRDNRGILTKVATDLGYSVGFVRLVYHGGTQSQKRDVEDALAKAGAPGFAEVAA